MATSKAQGAEELLRVGGKERAKLSEFGCLDEDVCERRVEAAFVIVAFHERSIRAEDRQV